MVLLQCNGHTGWGEAQTQGAIDFHVTISAQSAKHPAAQAQPEQ
jgi:hypothetical protein